MEDVQNETQRLIGYAKLDRELERSMAAYEEVPEDLRKNTELLKQMTEDLEHLQNDLGAWEKTSRDLAGEQATDVEKRKEKETRLNTIQNMRGHQAALKEIEEFKRRSKGREENLTLLATNLEKGKEKLAALQVEHAELEKTVAERMQALNNEREILKHQIEEKRKERDHYASTVSPALLKKYAHIAKLRRPAIAPIEHGVCSECHMQLPPQQHIELQKSRSFMVCPSCQRLLYIEHV